MMDDHDHKAARIIILICDWALPLFLAVVVAQWLAEGLR
jgi:hypothetical protein